MLMVISPAKTLDYETPSATSRFTQPEHLDHAQELIQQLRDFSPAQIAELMHLSDKLAGLNAARFRITCACSLASTAYYGHWT